MMPVGHRHPDVNQAVKEHMDHYVRTAPLGAHVLRWPVEYAKALSETFPSHGGHPQRVLFTEGEHEAVLAALNIAREVSGRSKLALVDTGVHSWVSTVNHVDHALLPIDEFFLDDFRWESCAALLMSLVCEDGRVLEGRWVQGVADKAKATGVPLIIDESRTGFGRTGTMWGHQNVNVDPDITVLGGPAGGGLALGAVVTSTANFAQSRVCYDISPQAGSPVACSAGAATLAGVNPGVLEHVKEAAGTFDDALQELVNQFPEYVVASYGVGLIRTVEFQSNALARDFEVASRSHGLLVAAPVDSSLILTPTLIASENELKRGVDLMAEVLLDWYERDAA